MIFMDPNQSVKDAQSKLSQAVEHFKDELKKLRTGRASAGMLDGIKVEAYGVEMNPSDDGRIVRVPVPPLTEERRREIVKQVGQKQEECMIQLRNIRRDAMDTIDKAKKGKDIGEDDAKRLSAQVEDAIKSAQANAEAAAKAREQEIMSL
jgi:ribosome recycling factor